MNTLDERRKKILYAIIQSHIDLNIPIGSFFITQKFQVGLSPATIRNTMAELEKLGYIMQPHTSAGRVPTEKGYRFYIDVLLEEQPLSLAPELYYELSTRLTDTEKTGTGIIKEAAKTLSLYSHCLAIVIPPKTEEMILKRIKFIKYEKKKVLTVLISENGVVYNKTIELEKAYSQNQLDKASNYLNNKFHGLSIKIVREKIADQLHKDKMICDQLISILLTLCKEISLSDIDDFTLNSLAGTANLPDFATIDQIKEILGAIEDKQFMLKLLNQISDSLGIRVFVGMEIIRPALKELSMVISTYKNKKDTSGAIGIIGPTRMNYKKLIPMVEYTAKALTKMLSA
ncbi:MAG: heat-inducible transcription repressor HrcA [Nitrospiraceae bacterium]|nr:MAG: heat-inducible transcription repressor HrcA [Nitrospiraceae bacterium]